jgi:hypothetical protein
LKIPSNEFPNSRLKIKLSPAPKIQKLKIQKFYLVFLIIPSSKGVPPDVTVIPMQMSALGGPDGPPVIELDSENGPPLLMEEMTAPPPEAIAMERRMGGGRKFMKRRWKLTCWPHSNT